MPGARCFLPIIFLLFSSFKCFSQDSCHLKISLITLSPGDELSTVFGHSTLRVVDSTKNDDLVFSYGTFDFNEPSFLTKFINGKLLYYLSNEDFLPFVRYYQSEKRRITEQELNLSCKEKKDIVSFLYNNLQAGNKFYKYDFISDNCTTRLRDLLEKNAEHELRFKRIVGKNIYYRNLLHAYLDYHDHQWIKLGIDILLGSRTDKVMNDRQVMFLPDYLMTTLEKSTIESKPIVKSKINLPAEVESNIPLNIMEHPLFILSILCVIIIYLSFNTKKRVREFLLRLDSLIFCVFGIIGIVLVYLWLGSDQLNYRDNFNLLWAWPTHFVFSFFSSNRFGKYYFRLTGAFYALLLLSWFFLPQHLNISLIPVIILIILRCFTRGFDLSLNSYYGRENTLL